MATYLLTWNPSKWPWDHLDSLARKSEKGKLLSDGWSCGNTQRISAGDRIFLLRQGQKSPGMIGSGWATSKAYRSPHWDPQKRKDRKKTWFINLDWDALVSVERRLPRSTLERGVLSQALLNVQSGGCSIDAASALKLEKLWAKHLKRPVSVAGMSQGVSQANEGEPVEHRSYRRKRDRSLRDAAMNRSKGKCEVCAKNYSKVLGGKGLRMLEVHHRKQLASNKAPRITKISDLAVVCANCHALIHFDPKKAIPVGRLKSMLHGKRTWILR